MVIAREGGMGPGARSLPESHLKLRFVIPDAWTQGAWFADLEFFPDRSTGTERLVFNQLVAECRSLEKFLNSWHGIEVQYDMNAYSGSMWLDGVRIFQKAPLQVSFPMLPSAEISLFTDPEARAEIWVDDVALKIGSRLFAEYRPQENKLYYYLSDQISSTRMITDGTGTVVYSAAHDPYGGIQKTWVSTYDPALKFSGKERDAEFR